MMEFKCNLCPRTYQNDHQLKAHSYSHTRKLYSCDSCTQQFSTMKGWVVHYKTGSCRMRNCLICGKEFSTNNALSRHSKLHMQDTSYQCEVCLKDFKTKDSLLIQGFHHSDSRPYSCSLCPAGFLRKSALKNHTNKIHENKERSLIECDICGENVESLKQHKRKHNSDEFPCNECTKTFTKKDKVEIHMKIHTGEKSFTCSVCAKKFRQKGHLDSHLKGVHFGIKEFHHNEQEEKSRIDSFRTGSSWMYHV